MLPSSKAVLGSPLLPSGVAKGIPCYAALRYEKILISLAPARNWSDLEVARGPVLKQFLRIDRRARRRRPSTFTLVATLVALFFAAAGAVGAATKLLDSELVASDSPVLQNVSGTVRIEDSRLGRLGPPVFVPEPGALLQLGSGIGLLALLAGRR